MAEDDEVTPDNSVTLSTADKVVLGGIGLSAVSGIGAALSETDSTQAKILGVTSVAAGAAAATVATVQQIHDATKPENLPQTALKFASFFARRRT